MGGRGLADLLFFRAYSALRRYFVHSWASQAQPRLNSSQRFAPFECTPH
jgi:hypothetical protein